MINSSQAQNTLKAFCQKVAIQLIEKERSYHYGISRSYTAKETKDDFEIEYSYNYEMPDVGVRPVELLIHLKSFKHNFFKVRVRRKSLIRSILSGESLDIQTNNKLSSYLNDAFEDLTRNYSLQDVITENRVLKLRFNGLPKTHEALTSLRDRIIKISYEIREGD